MHTVLLITERPDLAKAAMFSKVRELVVAITFSELSTKSNEEVTYFLSRRWDVIVLEVSKAEAAATLYGLAPHFNHRKLVYLRTVGVQDEECFKALFANIVAGFVISEPGVDVYGVAIKEYLSKESHYGLEGILRKIVEVQKLLIGNRTTAPNTEGSVPTRSIGRYYHCFDEGMLTQTVRNNLAVPITVSTLQGDVVKPGEEREVRGIYEPCYRAEGSPNKLIFAGGNHLEKKLIFCTLPPETKKEEEPAKEGTPTAGQDAPSTGQTIQTAKEAQTPGGAAAKVIREAECATVTSGYIIENKLERSVAVYLDGTFNILMVEGNTTVKHVTRVPMWWCEMVDPATRQPFSDKTVSSRATFIC